MGNYIKYDYIKLLIRFKDLILQGIPSGHMATYSSRGTFHTTEQVCILILTVMLRLRTPEPLFRRPCKAVLMRTLPSCLWDV